MLMTHYGKNSELFHRMFRWSRESKHDQHSLPFEMSGYETNHQTNAVLHDQMASRIAPEYESTSSYGIIMSRTL